MAPQEVIDRIKLREALRTHSYIDTTKNLTAGWGHLLVGIEKTQWPKGARVPDEVIAGWLDEDIDKAYTVAESQARRIGFDDSRLVNALTSVCFQLGGVWYKDFKKTWAYLLSKEWDNAAKEVQESLWFRQTPVRVQDFQEALRSLDLPLPATFNTASVAAQINNGGASS